MKLIRLIALPTAAAFLYASAPSAFADDEDGVAIAIVYDTSGSMRDSVMDKSGHPAPKYVIANRALLTIANQVQTFATNSASGTPRTIQAGLFIFANDSAKEVVKFGAFDATAIREDRKSTRLNSSHYQPSRMPSSA